MAWWLAARPTVHRLWLLLASWAFYAFWDVRFVPLLIGVSAFSTLLAARLQRTADGRAKKWLLAGGVAVLLATLVAFKYLTWLSSLSAELFERLGLRIELQAPEVLLPVGLSFFTFHGISLLVDAYRGQIPVRVRLLDGLLYVAFFPQLVAGPILRAKTFLPQLDEGPKASFDLGEAFVLFLGGLIKKVVLAGFLATHVVDPVWAAPESASRFDAWLAFYGYAAQIYCDFSGYTDMAIASALLLGYRFPQNFDAPYRAASLQDFWRRWHITLSTWLRDYLYIPLGGSRLGEARTALSLMLTMLLGGLWHGAGATFALWGALHGAGLVLHRAWSRWPAAQGLRAARVWPALAVALTFHAVAFGWVLFRAPSLELAGLFLRSLLGGTGTSHLSAAAALVVALALLAQALPAAVADALAARWSKAPRLAQGFAFALAVLLIDALSPDGLLPFIYFQF
jgi:alginate O-acetyltransferase complex protein AlgI